MDTYERTADGYIDTLTVKKTEDGWEVRETHDRKVVRTQHYSDWHRVERAVHVFDPQTYSTNR